MDNDDVPLEFQYDTSHPLWDDYLSYSHDFDSNPSDYEDYQKFDFDGYVEFHSEQVA